MKEKRLGMELDVEEIIDRKLAEMIGEHFKLKQREEEYKGPKCVEAHPIELHKRPEPPQHHEPLKVKLNFEENIGTIIDIFGDESTSHAIIKALKDSPTEIQIIARLVIDLHERLDKFLGEYEYKS